MLGLLYIPIAFLGLVVVAVGGLIMVMGYVVVFSGGAIVFRLKRMPQVEFTWVEL